jgi:hypothetical protein
MAEAPAAPAGTAAPSTDPAPAEPTGVQQQEPATGDELGDAGKKALEAERTRAKDAERRAKAAERELEQHRQASMSEAEKAVAEAEKRGAATATAQMAQRLVRSDFIAAASRINPEYDAAAVLDDLNLAKFVGEDGEPDQAAISKAVERLVPPAGTPRLPSFDGGARTTAPASVGMYGLIRKAAGRA